MNKKGFIPVIVLLIFWALVGLAVIIPILSLSIKLTQFLTSPIFFIAVIVAGVWYVKTKL